jgi:hypothetical protein
MRKEVIASWPLVCLLVCWLKLKPKNQTLSISELEAYLAAPKPAYNHEFVGQGAFDYNKGKI